MNLFLKKKKQKSEVQRLSNKIKSVDLDGGACTMVQISKYNITLRKRSFLLLSLTLFFIGCSDGSSPGGTQPTIEIGAPAPSFSIDLLKGGTVTLDSYRGNPLVLIYMASWCPCSKESAPVFKEVYEKYHKVGVEFLMLGMQDSGSKFKKFVEKQDFKFPAAFDKGDKVATLYGVSAPPTTFFIGADGNIASSFYGKIVELDKLSAWIDAIVPGEGTS